MQRLIQNGALLLAILGLVLGFFSQGFAQNIAMEVEPNDPCTQAQAIGESPVPFIVEGSLDAPPEVPDVDFYRFSATPGTQLVADLEGQATGKGTLADPFLGFFSSDCELLALNDDNFSLNARLGFEVPADGVFVLAASSCCDADFVGEGCCSGTYQLTISPPPLAIGSITGRAVDATSGQPLPGNIPPFAFVELARCEDDECLNFNVVSGQSTDSEGRFLFDRDFSDQLLPVGIYRVRAFANGYQGAETEPFAVGAGENLDVGDIPLIRPPAIGAITGRVVDAASGQPLPGNTTPFAVAELGRCEDDECLNFNVVSGQSTDSEGRFLFDRDFSDQLLPVGIYRVRAFANEFQDAETEPFAVGEGENADVGDIPLIPPPIFFSEIEPCDELLPQGGTCRYSIRINNNTSAPLRGLAWSPVDGSSLGSSLDFTTFEASQSRLGSSRTSAYVRRQRVSLRAFSSGVYGFQFGVPSFVPDGATFCARIFFGLEPDPLVNTIREGSLFCITKGVTGFQVMSESESQELLRSLSGRNKMMMTKRSGIPARKQ